MHSVQQIDYRNWMRKAAGKKWKGVQRAGAESWKRCQASCNCIKGTQLLLWKRERRWTTSRRPSVVSGRAAVTVVYLYSVISDRECNVG